MSLLMVTMFLVSCASKQAAEKKWISINTESNEPVALIDSELKEIRYYADKEEVIRTLVKILIQASEKKEDKLPKHVQEKKKAAEERKTKKSE